MYIVDKPVKWSELTASGATREEITAKLLARCNEIGRMTFTEEESAAQTAVEEVAATANA